MKIYWLTKKTVSILMGQSQTGTDIWNVYDNSPKGRVNIASDLPADIVAEVMVVWGNVATVQDIATEP